MVACHLLIPKPISDPYIREEELIVDASALRKRLSRQHYSPGIHNPR